MVNPVKNTKPAGLGGRSGLKFLRVLVYLRQSLPPALDAHGDDGGDGVRSTSALSLVPNRWCVKRNPASGHLKF